MADNISKQVFYIDVLTSEVGIYMQQPYSVESDLERSVELEKVREQRIERERGEMSRNRVGMFRTQYVNGELKVERVNLPESYLAPCCSEGLNSESGRGYYPYKSELDKQLEGKLSTRASGVLERNGITSLNGLLQLTEERLLLFRSCGSKTLEDIKWALNESGHSLREE